MFEEGTVLQSKEGACLRELGVCECLKFKKKNLTFPPLRPSLTPSALLVQCPMFRTICFCLSGCCCVAPTRLPPRDVVVVSSRSLIRVYLDIKGMLAGRRSRAKHAGRPEPSCEGPDPIATVTPETAEVPLCRFF